MFTNHHFSLPGTLIGIDPERQPLVTSAVTLEDGTLAVVLKATELVLLARSQQAKARAAAATGQKARGRP